MEAHATKAPPLIFAGQAFEPAGDRGFPAPYPSRVPVNRVNLFPDSRQSFLNLKVKKDFVIT
jgi:hypothetical protein